MKHYTVNTHPLELNITSLDDVSKTLEALQQKVYEHHTYIHSGKASPEEIENWNSYWNRASESMGDYDYDDEYEYEDEEEDE